MGFLGGSILSTVPREHVFFGGVIYGVTLVGVIYIIAGSYFLTRLQRIVWSHTRLGELHFRSTIQATTLLGVVARNLLLVVVTAGLNGQKQWDGPLPTLRHRVPDWSCVNSGHEWGEVK